MQQDLQLVEALFPALIQITHVYTCFVRKKQRQEASSNTTFILSGIPHRYFEAEIGWLFQVNKKWKPLQEAIFQILIPGNQNVN